MTATSTVRGDSAAATRGAVPRLARDLLQRGVGRAFALRLGYRAHPEGLKAVVGRSARRNAASECRRANGLWAPTRAPDSVSASDSPSIGVFLSALTCADFVGVCTRRAPAAQTRHAQRRAKLRMVSDANQQSLDGLGCATNYKHA
mmetsp:Transcript_39900/g.71706  ORF Transcript_39900/g.71706 Transcript_39900/m.71706 type:complete len:146 (+) Transcript_39900:1595-2032(+)